MGGNVRAGANGSAFPQCNGRWHVAFFTSVVVGAACLEGGCQTVFDGELGVIGCTDEGAQGPPACPDGDTCLSGFCIAPGATLGASCATDAECSDGSFCLDPTSLGSTGPPVCSRACCSSTDCGALWVQDQWVPLACVPTVDGTRRACALELAPTAVGAVGAACTADDQCRGGICLGVSDAPGYCSDTCCDDDGCGDIVSFSCQQAESGGTWALRCVRK